MSEHLIDRLCTAGYKGTPPRLTVLLEKKGRSIFVLRVATTIYSAPNAETLRTLTSVVQQMTR